jgi:hypothetical protein
MSLDHVKGREGAGGYVIDNKKRREVRGMTDDMVMSGGSIRISNM